MTRTLKERIDPTVARKKASRAQKSIGGGQKKATERTDTGLRVSFRSNSRLGLGAADIKKNGLSVYAMSEYKREMIYRLLRETDATTD